MVNLERASRIIRETSYKPTALARAGGRLRSLHSARPTARAATVSFHRAVRAASRRARLGRLCAIPARRARRPAAPTAFPQLRGFQMSLLNRQSRIATGLSAQFNKPRNEQATSSPPKRYPRWRDRRVPSASMVWLARAVKVVFWRTAEKEKALLGRPPESPP